MTDKQIIIDGCDVSGCEWFKKWSSRCSLFDCPCGGHPKCDSEILFNCYYKQLKRKEQECEELKEKIKANGFGCFNIEMSEQLDQLKADLLDQEAETLKAGGVIHKLEKTLTEIKEIANSQVWRIGDDKTIEKILEKISEVFDERI